jgi:hypothetical protein
LRPVIAERGAERADLEEQLAGVAKELDRLTAAIAAGGELEALRS